MALKKLTAPGGGRPFAPWRILVWLVMLLAAAGFVLNTYAAVVIGGAVTAMSAEAASQGPDPRVALAWTVGYLLAAFVVMVFALSTLRWREWARSGMRVIALLLVAWAAYTAWVGYDQWQQMGVVLSQPGLPAPLLEMAAKHRTILLIGVVLKLVSIPVLAWLAWALGSVKVREQFGQVAL